MRRVKLHLLFYDIVWISVILCFAKITWEFNKVGMYSLNWIMGGVIGILVVGRFIIKIK